MCAYLPAPLRPPEAEIVDHSAALGRRVFLLPLEDFLYDGIEAAMAFKGVPIGISDGLAKHEGLFFALAHISGYPRLEPPAGAVQQGLVPGYRNHLDPPAGLAEHLPKRAVGGSPGVQLTTGSHAGVDVDKNGRLRSKGNRHLEGEIVDQPLGMAGVDPAGQQVSLDPELLKAGDLRGTVGRGTGIERNDLGLPAEDYERGRWN